MKINICDPFEGILVVFLSNWNISSQELPKVMHWFFLESILLNGLSNILWLAMGSPIVNTFDISLSLKLAIYGSLILGSIKLLLTLFECDQKVILEPSFFEF